MITSELQSGSSSCKTGIDLGLAAAAFGQQVNLVFSGSSLPLLYIDTNLEPDTYRLLGSAPFYGIDKCYAVLPGIKFEGEFRTDIAIRVLDSNNLHAILDTADIVLNY